MHKRSKQPLIVHVLHSLGVGGAEVLAARLSRDLRDRYHFGFFCLDEPGSLAQELRSEGFIVETIGRKEGLDWSVSARLKKLMRHHRVDLIHAHQYTPFFYSLLSRAIHDQPPILFTEHGRHFPDHASMKRGLFNRLMLKSHDRITAVGHFIRHALITNEYLPPDRIDVIYNGCPDASRHRAKPSCQLRREALGLSPEQPVFIQVARFHPVKDHATAIRAFAQIHQDCPEARLLLVGNGSQQSTSRELAASLGLDQAVAFLGLRRDIPELLELADVFVLSSLSEGISVTLLEAMAAGLPIVATDVGGNREVVIHEHNGLLSPRRDAFTMASHMLRMIEDPDLRMTMGRAGRHRYETRFTQRIMHRGYAAIYEQMLSSGQVCRLAA